MVTDELRTRFRDLLEMADECHLEYEESHGDAGDAYTHMVMEDKRHCIEKLEEYIQANFSGVTESEIELVIEAFDKWCFDMQPGNRFSCVAPEDGVLLRSRCIEEVENQHEVSRYAEELDCTENEVRELVREEAEKGNFCLRYYGTDNFSTFQTYQVTDACWLAVLPRSWIVDQLEEIREEE